jgi:hypothetical protein
MLAVLLLTFSSLLPAAAPQREHVSHESAD